MTELSLAARLAPEWNRRAANTDLSQASEADLRYGLLLGDVELAAGDVDLSARWGWVPLFDFIVGLVTLLRRLATSSEEAFEFTESGSELRFYRSGDDVEIRSNYAPGIITIGYDDLLDAVLGFARDSLRRLGAAAPTLESNEVFNRIMKEVCAA